MKSNVRGALKVQLYSIKNVSENMSEVENNQFK